MNPRGFFLGEVELIIKPSFLEFQRMCEYGNLIPVYTEFLADTETPVSAYLKIKDRSCSFLLESADGGKQWGRYSFIGYKPFLVFASRDGEILLREGNHKKTLRGIENPLLKLRELNASFKPVTLKELPPFQGGFVGYVNYDIIRKWEPVPNITPENMELPETFFTACGRMIIFDHYSHMIRIVAFARPDKEEDIRAKYEMACAEIDETIRELKQPLNAFQDNHRLSMTALKSNFEKEDFKKAVEKAREYIISGDVIQVVLSQKFSAKAEGDVFSLYRNLRSVNPSPYMFYLNFDDIKLIGASPEILVRLTDRKIELRPIAGTRQRGASIEEDESLEKELIEDPKERAEHIMLVDLGRNDVGRVAEAGSVRVPRLMEIERYSHVMHIVSRVEGTLRRDKDCFDLFMSAFPAGTVSGAPKIRAMEIISELEPSSRGPYAGAVGYFGFNGNMDFCITIRTITIIRDRLSIQVGAGIVYDSSPENEHNETIRKAGAMFKAIERAKGNDSAD